MENTFTIYPKDLTPECQARLNAELIKHGETLDETNWDSFGCAQVILPELYDEENETVKQ